MKPNDFKKEVVYKAKTKPEIVEIPDMLFVMVDGMGAPESKVGETEFQLAMQVLFGVAYTIKFWDKKFTPPAGYTKFTLAPIEALWWMENGLAFDVNQPEKWRWTTMLRLPEFVTPEFFQKAVDAVVAAKGSEIYRKARLEHFNEGTCVQILHVGPYDGEQTDIETMHTFAKDQGYSVVGKHHELYFGDPRRTRPEKLKTILRQPIAK